MTKIYQGSRGGIYIVRNSKRIYSKFGIPPIQTSLAEANMIWNNSGMSQSAFSIIDAPTDRYGNANRGRISPSIINKLETLPDYNTKVDFVKNLHTDLNTIMNNVSACQRILRLEQGAGCVFLHSCDTADPVTRNLIKDIIVRNVWKRAKQGTYNPRLGIFVT